MVGKYYTIMHQKMHFYIVLAGAPDTAYRLITTQTPSSSYKLPITYNTNYMNNIFKPVID
jgi:hypothetical protein